MSKASAEIVRPQAEDYAPYHLFPEFTEGYNAYLKANYDCPYGRDSGISGQAWDRGMEYAMRLKRWELRANSNLPAT